MLRTVFALIAKSIYKDMYILVWSIILPLGLFIGIGLYHELDSYREGLLVGSIVVSLVMGAINTSGFWLMTQRRRGVFKLLKLSSLPISKFIVSSMLARLLIFEAITVLLIVTGWLIFGLTIGLVGIGMLLGMTLVGFICLNSIGYVIASRVSNEGMMNMMSSVLATPMIFISTAFYSLDNAPKWIQYISKLNPVEYVSIIGRNAMSGEAAAQAMIILGAMALAGAVVAVKTFRYE